MDATNSEDETGHGFDGGWVKMFRQLQNERVFHDPHLWQLYCYLVFRARHKPGAVSLAVGRNTTTKWLDVGQVIVGRDALAEALNVKPTTVWDRLLRLEKLGMISKDSDNHKSVVSVINFQGSQYVEPVDIDKQVTTNRQPIGKRSSSKRQPGDTNKECKNEKNQKNETRERESICTPSQQEVEDEYRKYLEEINQTECLEQKEKLRNAEAQMDVMLADGSKLKKEWEALPKDSPNWLEKRGVLNRTYEDYQDKKSEVLQIQKEINDEQTFVPEKKITSTSRQLINYIQSGKVDVREWKSTLRIWANREIENPKGIPFSNSNRSNQPESKRKPLEVRPDRHFR
jgi:hypothetical protein